MRAAAGRAVACFLVLCLQFGWCEALSSFVPARFLRIPILSSQAKGKLGKTESLTISPVRQYDVTPYHNLTAQNCLLLFNTSLEKGLSEEDVANRLKVFGRNALMEPPVKSFFRLTVEQLENKLAQLLLGVAIISALVAYMEQNVKAFTEPIIIGIVLVLNAVVGALQSSTAQNALRALKKLQPTVSIVLRNGRWREEFAENLVPGDLVSLNSGDKVPADGRIVSCKSGCITVDESSLTGESMSVSKDPGVIDENVAMADMSNTVFGGTIVTQGSCLFVVTNTGGNTQIGKINSGILAAESSCETKTPLMKSLDEFSDQMFKAVTLVSLCVWMVNIPKIFGPNFSSWQRGAMHYAKFAVALGVAAIPEGLPAMVTMFLALGTSKLAKRHVIVKKLPSVETLGCTSVICTDKTGTLTTNQMTTKQIVTLGENAQTKIKSVNEIFRGNESAPSRTFVETFAAICSLCNNAKLYRENGTTISVGEPTETALKLLVEEIAASQAMPSSIYSDANLRLRYTPLHEIEFSRDRKMMTTINRDQSRQSNMILSKGAAEFVLSRCNRVMLENGTVIPLLPNIREDISKSFQSLASKSYRCLGIAFREAIEVSEYLDRVETTEDASNLSLLQSSDRHLSIEDNLTFVGVCGIVDPPRPEVAGAIKACSTSGVKTIMITGDSKPTAISIAKDIGMLSSNESNEARAFTGSEFFNLESKQQYDILNQTGNLVFCRAEPRDKQRLVVMLEQLGHVIAMTGDGVNDAPALKQADIGIAMGLTGSEVSKGAADMVLVDDNFNSILSAVEEGRNIYSNMKSFIFFLVSSNVGEVLSILAAACMGLPDILSPIQLLWINLVTDGPPALSIGFNPPHRDIMKQPPRPRKEAIFSKPLVARMLLSGAYVAFAALSSFVHWFQRRGVSYQELLSWEKCDGASSSRACHLMQSSLSRPQSMTMTTIVLIEMLKGLSAVSLEGSLLSFPPWRNPVLVAGTIFPLCLHALFMYVPLLANVLHLHPLTAQEWKTVAMLSAPILLVEELLKLWHRLRTPDIQHHNGTHNQNYI